MRARKTKAERRRAPWTSEKSKNRDLWQGGPWERSGPQPGSPGAMPPRYVPPRPVLRPRRRKRRFSLPICMGLAALLISLVAISAVMESCGRCAAAAQR